MIFLKVLFADDYVVVNNKMQSLFSVASFLLWNILITKGTDGEYQCPTTAFDHVAVCPGTSERVSWTREECDQQGCCWIPNSDFNCYQKDCKAGYFGSLCQFQCQCSNGFECDSVTGECHECDSDKWGVGCLLDNSCSYNDPKGHYYMGKLDQTVSNKNCIEWTTERGLGNADFADRDVVAAGSYCRNFVLKYKRDKPWCFHTRRGGSGKRYEFCNITECACPVGRYDVNCQRECHCANPEEQCSQMTGSCPLSQCHPNWMGVNCSECADGHFGSNCQHVCHCTDPNEVCNKTTGVCQSKCAAGWMGSNCQTACSRGNFGDGCQLACNCKSPDVEACDRRTGECPRFGCRPGYGGPGCQTMLPEMTQAPTLVTRSSTTLTCSWRNWTVGQDRGNGPVSGYYIHYRQPNESSWTILPNVSSPYTLQDLLPNQIIELKVAAVHARVGVVGPPSPASRPYSTCGRPLSAPLAPKLRTISSVPSTTSSPRLTDDEEEEHEEFPDSPDETVNLLLEWKMPQRDKLNCDRVQQCRIYTRQTSGDFVLASVVNHSMIRNEQLQNIDPFTNLTIGISIVNNAGLESDLVELFYHGRSGPVSQLEVTASSSTELAVHWLPPVTNNGPVTSYMLSYRQVQQGGCAPVEHRWSRAVELDLDSTDYQLSNLPPFTKYQVKLYAATSAGRGQVTSTVGLTEAAEPPAIEGLHHVNVTTKAVQFIWRPVDCQNYNGAYVGYEYELIDVSNSDQSGDDGSEFVMTQDIVNRTNQEFYSLVPFTNYSFRVSLRNSRFRGPQSTVNFVTSEDVPPVPRDFRLQSRTSNSLTFTWIKPYPPNGVLSGYAIRYQRAQSTGGQNKPYEAQTVELSSDILEHTLFELQPHTSYITQIRAKTRVGYGAWSDVLSDCMTDEDYPTEPLNFANTSRTSTTASFHWLNPLHANGVIRNYWITCTPATEFGRRRMSNVYINETIAAAAREFTVTGLLPGLSYVCKLGARTGKGPGPMATRLFFTKPDVSTLSSVPRLETSKIYDDSVVIILHPPEVPDSMEDADNLYRVVVETVSPSSGSSGRRKRRDLSDTGPCSLTSTELTDHETAEKNNVACYIAAELVVVNNEQSFTVGDSKVHGGFWNAPLDKSKGYRIWFGLVVTVDGASATSYASVSVVRVAKESSTPLTYPDQNEPDSASSAAGIAIGIFIAVIIVVAVIVAVIVLRLRKKKRRQNHSHLPNVFVDGAGTATKLVSPHAEATAVDEEDESDMEMDTFLPKTQTSNVDLIKSLPVSVSELHNYVASKKLAVHNGLKQEYQMISDALQFSCDVARREENRIFNRYGNIIAYDHSRVILDCSNIGDTDYINANYIDGYNRPAMFVATQADDITDIACLNGCVVHIFAFQDNLHSLLVFSQHQKQGRRPNKQTINDFWRMVWQLKSTRIVMLANLMEDGRRKCEQYWPDSGAKNYGEMVVELRDTESFADFKIRTFKIAKGDEHFVVTHYHFTGWPDHGVPSQGTSLLSFHRKYRNGDAGSGPAIIHCSAGVGRTGTFIALDCLLEQAKYEGVVDVLGCVNKMRKNRIKMIQTPEQYLFVYDTLLEALTTGDTAIPCSDFRKHYADLMAVNPTSGKVRCLEEFETLGVVSNPSNRDDMKIDGLSHENIDKNRVVSIVPVSRMSRPFLLTSNAGSTDYINAVFVDGYKQRDAFIVTQTPMPGTVVDFWTMIHDHCCRTIVMMNDVNPAGDKTVAAYFPSSVGNSQTYGLFSVELVSLNDKTNDAVIVRDFMLTSNDKKSSNEPVTVRHFEFRSWPHGTLLPSKASILSLLSLIEQWQQRSGNGVITVHCLDGASRSGFLCAVSYMLERVKAEQDVDVFDSVKHSRINRSQIVPTYDQYRFLYDMAIEFLDCFETYSNFK